MTSSARSATLQRLADLIVQVNAVHGEYPESVGPGIALDDFVIEHGDELVRALRGAPPSSENDVRQLLGAALIRLKELGDTTFKMPAPLNDTPPQPASEAVARFAWLDEHSFGPGDWQSIVDLAIIGERALRANGGSSDTPQSETPPQQAREAGMVLAELERVLQELKDEPMGYQSQVREEFVTEFGELCWTHQDTILAALSADGGSNKVPDDEALLLYKVLDQARETLLISLKGTPEELHRSLGKLNLACLAHWNWRGAKIAAAPSPDSQEERK